MSRDHLLPAFFRKLSRRGIPALSVYVTVGLTLLCIFGLDAMKVAKLAGAFQLVIFALICAATIVMRESGLESYDPGFRSPLYPWMQIAGIIAPFMIVSEMGTLSIFFSIGLIIVCLIWYAQFARPRVNREGAMYHVFARLGKYRYEALDAELRGILKEKGLREEDPFDEVVARAFVVESSPREDFNSVVKKVASHLATRVKHTADEIAAAFERGTRTGATPVTHGVALPHIWLDTLDHPELVLVRAREGLVVRGGVPGADEERTSETVRALFFLASPEGNPGQHLRILAQIAGRVDEEDFMAAWLEAADEQTLKEVLLRDERFLSLFVLSGSPTSELIGRSIKDVRWPAGSLIALVRREEETLIPRGDTELCEGDRITVIGEPASLKEIHERYEV